MTLYKLSKLPNSIVNFIFKKDRLDESGQVDKNEREELVQRWLKKTYQRTDCVTDRVRRQSVNDKLTDYLLELGKEPLNSANIGKIIKKTFRELPYIRGRGDLLNRDVRTSYYGCLKEN